MLFILIVVMYIIYNLIKVIYNILLLDIYCVAYFIKYVR